MRSRTCEPCSAGERQDRAAPARCRPQLPPSSGPTQMVVTVAMTRAGIPDGYRRRQHYRVAITELTMARMRPRKVLAGLINEYDRHHDCQPPSRDVAGQRA